MEKSSTGTHTADKKIYVVMIGSAPMSSLGALLLSLERFKNVLGSESSQTRFETTLRSVQPTLLAVNAFINNVYAEKDPKYAVNMKGNSLVVEVAMSQNEFMDNINMGDVEKILTKVTAVGSLPAKKLPTQVLRPYTAFPVKYNKGEFVKV